MQASSLNHRCFAGLRFQSPCGEMVNARNIHGVHIRRVDTVSIPLRGNGECKFVIPTKEWGRCQVFQSPCGEMVNASTFFVAGYDISVDGRFNPLAGKW